MQHTVASRVVISVSVIASIAVMFAGVNEAAKALGVQPFDFTWRWYALAYIAAISALLGVFFLLWRRVRLRSGALIWFSLFLGANILYDIILLLQTLSANAATAAFWQGISPMGWLVLPVLLLLFALSFVDDLDIPRNVRFWLLGIGALPIVLYMSAMTDMLEHHRPADSLLGWWGYQNTPGDYSMIIFAWAATISIVGLFILVRALRRAVDPARKKQLKIFVIALAQYLGLALLFDVVLYEPFPHLMPSTSPLYLVVAAIAIGYGILRYGLFQITPARLAEPILQNLSEAVFGVNSHGKIEFANAGAQKIFGYDPVALRGASIAKLFASTSLQQTIKPALSPSVKTDTTFDELTVKDAQSNDVTVAVNVSPIIGEREHVAGHIITVQNITELKRKTIELAQQKADVEQRVIERTKELHEERAKLRASIESLALGFLLVGNDGEIVMQNKVLKKLVGAEVQLRDIDQLCELLDNKTVARLCKEALRTRASRVLKDVNYKDRVWRIFVTSVSAAEQGEAPIGVVVLIEDITEAKVLERSKDEFFSIASHELRTPLTAIRGNASMILNYYKDEIASDEVTQVIGDIHESSVRLIDIVNDFLDLSRLEQGKVLFEYSHCSLDKIIESVIYEMKTDLREKKLHVQYDGMTLGELPVVWADAGRVKQIVYNLVGNALKFTERGSIAINAEVDGKFVRVDVVDTGRGIAEAYRKFLFRKFQQAGDSLLTRDTTRGTGLGLYISRLMAVEMGGDVWLEQTEEGKGSTFSFKLPIATARNAAQSEKALTTINVETGLTEQ